MRQTITDAIGTFLGWFQEQEPTCEEISELRARTQEEIRPLKPGRRCTLTIEKRQRICSQVLAFLAQDDNPSLKEAWEAVARNFDLKPRTIRYVWGRRREIGFSETEMHK